MKQPVSLKVNGEVHDLLLEPQTTLLEALREHIRLTGTKEGCDLGTCGACTVLLEGRPVLSCLTLALSAEGREIITIEGLAGEDGRLDPLQAAFIEQGAVQCGFCTPGMVLSAKALLARNPRPSPEEIRRGVAGNICRCTGYLKIFKAVSAAAEDGACP